MSVHLLLATTISAVVVLAVGVLAWSLSSVAVRLDRLHRRIETTQAALDAALARRAAVTEVLATCGLLDPASALLLAAAVAEVLAPLDATERASAEMDLARALRAVLDAGAVDRLHAAGASPLLADLDAACGRVVLARRFADDALAHAARVRRRRLVRWGHLAGRSVLPLSVPADDSPPALAPRAQRRAGRG